MATGSAKKARGFCRAYIESMDLSFAAAQAGLSVQEALELLEEEPVVQRLDKYRQLLARQICADDAVRRMSELAFGKANDCVRLVMEEEPRIQELDLGLLSELKRGSNGVVEIKLVDRLKVLDRLLELLGGTSDEAASFFRALDEAGELE